MNQKELLIKHPYDIWMGERDGRWYTYFPDPQQGRVLKSRKKKEDLLNLIANFYEESSQPPAVSEHCFPDEYADWIAERTEYGEITPSSLCRYESDYRRFFPATEEFCMIPIRSIDEECLEHFIKRTIRDKQLTEKTYGGLRILLMGVFKFAKGKKHTALSISSFFKDLYLPRNIFARRTTNETAEYFTIEEVELLASYLLGHPTTRHLGILLQIYSGIRVGELVALKAEDNIRNTCLNIRRTESTRFNDITKKKETYIKDFPKTRDGWRTVILPQQAQEILNALKDISVGEEFLLSEDHCRITERKINLSLQNACRAVGIQPRSTHKLRRSYASLLLMKGTDAAFVKNQMGHSQIATTEAYYHFDITPDTAKQDTMNSIFGFLSKDE